MILSCLQVTAGADYFIILNDHTPDPGIGLA
jgi:hypothetical protein